MTGSGGLFGEEPAHDAEQSALVSAYVESKRTLDDLPYTAEFAALFERVSADEPGLTQHAVFHRLHNMRKAGRLPAKSPDTKPATAPTKISDEAKAALREIVETSIGRISLRDRLPYTDEFNDMVQRFNTGQGLALEPHQVWRLIATMGKEAK